MVNSVLISNLSLSFTASQQDGGKRHEVALSKEIHGFGYLYGFRGFWSRPGGTESEPTGADRVDGISMPRRRPRGNEGA